MSYPMYSDYPLFATKCPKYDIYVFFMGYLTHKLLDWF